MTTQFDALTQALARVAGDETAVARGNATVRMALDVIRAGLTGDQDGVAIVALLEALTGNARLDAAAALRNLQSAVDAAVGDTTWRTAMGGALTGPEIVALMEALTGNDRLNATALRLLADQLDAELGQTDWRLGGGGSDTAAQILAKLLTVDGAGSGLRRRPVGRIDTGGSCSDWPQRESHTDLYRLPGQRGMRPIIPSIATVAGITTLQTADELILLLPAAMPGRGTSFTNLSVNGESRLPLRPLIDGSGFVPSHELIPGEILLLFRAGSSGYRLLEPHILERAGVWANAGRIYLRGQDVVRGTTDYKLLSETSTGEDPATHPEIWLPFPHTWQFGGINLGPVITGINFEGAGVVSSVNNGVWTLTIAAGGVPPTPPTDDFYFWHQRRRNAGGRRVDHRCRQRCCHRPGLRWRDDPADCAAGNRGRFGERAAFRRYFADEPTGSIQQVRHDHCAYWRNPGIQCMGFQPARLDTDSRRNLDSELIHAHNVYRLRKLPVQ